MSTLIIVFSSTPLASSLASRTSSTSNRSMILINAFCSPLGGWCPLGCTWHMAWLQSISGACIVCSLSRSTQVLGKTSAVLRRVSMWSAFDERLRWDVRRDLLRLRTKSLAHTLIPALVRRCPPNVPLWPCGGSLNVNFICLYVRRLGGPSMLGYGQYTADRRQMVTNRHTRAQNGQKKYGLNHHS